MIKINDFPFEKLQAGMEVTWVKHKAQNEEPTATGIIKRIDFKNKEITIMWHTTSIETHSVESLTGTYLNIKIEGLEI